MILFLLSLYLSCKRVAPPPQVGGVIEQIELANPSIIPLEFGKLISISEPMPGTAHLWFQDDSSTIRMVQFSYGKQLISKDVWVINRH